MPSPSTSPPAIDGRLLPTTQRDLLALQIVTFAFVDEPPLASQPIRSFRRYLAIVYLHHDTGLDCPINGAAAESLGGPAMALRLHRDFLFFLPIDATKKLNNPGTPQKIRKESNGRAAWYITQDVTFSASFLAPHSPYVVSNAGGFGREGVEETCCWRIPPATCVDCHKKGVQKQIPLSGMGKSWDGCDACGEVFVPRLYTIDKPFKVLRSVLGDPGHCSHTSSNKSCTIA
ncbi:hypothetical protein MKZ38_010588 [Zalerion maritima]|uniref:Uncharacterized protein n=1 Tax=Zalerion maritima TaxID=339359 RepID=A0AAD5RFX3_9PEZI|nr:hypothetical protein MKZ38_010588 [Zalerion maritima]